ncbi:hypothetical protein ACH5RR_040872 [Cinchona calisaya]|uniref:Ionotropic glutamate receptor C-terminal domain-containing protein n=1 Tax=Cinchona calisaya TaxID=153742 RepID=A0ABD2XVE0_9GENT
MYEFLLLAFVEEKTISNLSRFVLVIWFLVVLILTQSYTASLSSMLTVQQLQPSITDVNELIKSKEHVGYHEGSFVSQLLQEMGFDKSRLVAFASLEKCDQLMSSGSIAAAFDEIPYMKLLIAKYCSKYQMVGATYKTGGFGFVFPIGSPLVTNVSRGILNVTESQKMLDIEKRWFQETPTCPISKNSTSSSSLGLESFWGLFVIAGVASFSAFIIYLAMFLYEHWDILVDTNTPIKCRILKLARRFDDKDLSCHIFKKTGLHVENNNNGNQIVRVDETDISSCPDYPPSTATFSVEPSTHTNSPPSPRLPSHTKHNSNSGDEVSLYQIKKG